MRAYSYVGPRELLTLVGASARGAPIASRPDLAKWAGTIVTFVVTLDGLLRVADRHTEHVVCAGGEPVLSAGEMHVERDRIARVSNQSTGYCPEPESWPAVASALDRAGIARPKGFDDVMIFRKCPSCAQRNIVKDGDYTCAVCGAALPADWNFE